MQVYWHMFTQFIQLQLSFTSLAQMCAHSVSLFFCLITVSLHLCPFSICEVGYIVLAHLTLQPIRFLNGHPLQRTKTKLDPHETWSGEGAWRRSGWPSLPAHLCISLNVVWVSLMEERVTTRYSDLREGVREGEFFVYEGKQETHTHTMKRIHAFDCQGYEKNWSSNYSVCVCVFVWWYCCHEAPAAVL